MAVQPTETRWRALSVEPLQWVDWEEDILVYQPDAGKTHILNQLGAALLQRLDAGPCTSGALVEESADTLGVEPDTDFAANVDQLLRKFEELGLVAGTPAVDGT